MQLRCKQLVAHTLMVADMPGLSLRGSGYSTLKALPAGSSLYVNLMTCKAAWAHAPTVLLRLLLRGSAAVLV